MVAPKKPENEDERLKNLKSYDILDTLPEKDYDNITVIAAQICNVPVSLITLIDDNRQWFKANHGLCISETPRQKSFCELAMKYEDDIFIINDARLDIRFHDNPLVTTDPKVVFYAGVPLKSKNGLQLGTLSVIDYKPNKLSEGQKKSLVALSDQVMNLLELRKSKLLLERAMKSLEEKNQELERFAYIAAHDLKSPLINISSLAELLRDEYKLNLDSEGLKMLELIMSSADSLKGLVDGLLSYSRSARFLKDDKSIINLETLKAEVVQLFNSDHSIKMVIDSPLTTITINKMAIHHIMMNLVSNAIKYNDKNTVEIEINVQETDLFYEFLITDNGPGIDQAHQNKIFELFTRVASTDKFGQAGSGIGLATVKKIIKKLGGTISVHSELGQGATFSFSIMK